ncbi:MAG TPA: choice-of-anchor D domain-containing protein [Solirubrobacterales bacterium]|nr:choice-of-anchor D domain-containing protein [Solirubrobacterales bacterium]
MVTSRLRAAFAGTLAVLVLSTAGISAASAAPVAELTPPSHDFGQQNVGTESTRFDFTLANTGDGQITVSSVGKAGGNPGQFKIKPASTCETAVVLDAVSPDCRIRVTFDPGSLGTKTASIEVVTDLSPTPLTVQVTGTSVAVPSVGIGVSSAAIPFETIGVDELPTVPRTLVISSTGSLPLNIADITSSGDTSQFRADLTACAQRTLGQDQSCLLPITFDPDSAGLKRAQLSIASNAASSPTVVSLAGTATAPPKEPAAAEVRIARVLPRVTGRALRLPLTCSTGDTARCSGNITVRTTGAQLGKKGKAGKRRFVVGKAVYSQTAVRGTATVKLKRFAAKALRRRGGMKLSIAYSVKQPGGTTDRVVNRTARMKGR